MPIKKYWKIQTRPQLGPLSGNRKQVGGKKEFYLKTWKSDKSYQATSYKIIYKPRRDQKSTSNAASGQKIDLAIGLSLTAC
mmetsp:Transcript_13293/g.27521  ORF Transcript_13293/g.27521 Transcript_13293/m.27521 type:complete len:81 (+) Transcript_13293:208-450(+)